MNSPVDPVVAALDLEHHRPCRRCKQWFALDAGALQVPDRVGGRIAAMLDESYLRFECNACTRAVARRRAWVVGSFVAVFAAILLLERLGWIH